MQSVSVVKLIAVILTAAAVMLAFSCCVTKTPPDAGETLDGKVTIFAPPETTEPAATETDTESVTEQDTTGISPETTAEETSEPTPEVTTSPETSAPETEPEESEDAVFGDGFSGLY